MEHTLTIILFVLGAFLGIAQTVLGWFAKTLWDAVQELKTDLAKLREEMAKDYVPKEDFRDFTKEVRELLEAIRDRLDNKADK